MGRESIYTIPINEAFEFTLYPDVNECPFCLLYSSLEENELERITGAAMMEPDVRIQTNKLGFCNKHLSDMFQTSKKLPMGLMMESLINEQYKSFFPKLSIDGNGSKLEGKLDEFNSSCYVCSRINDSFSKMVDNALYLYETDDDFKIKYENQKYFCLPHYKTLISHGRNELSKKVFKDFLSVTEDKEKKYMTTLGEDVSWYCKKFDYRYADEPWKNSKDSLPRTITFLSGGINDKSKKFKI